MKIIIFGAGHFGSLYAQQEKTAQIVGFVDNNASLWEKTCLGHKIIPPENIKDHDFDQIIICVNDYTMCGQTGGAKAVDSIYPQLLAMGIDEEKISVDNIAIRHDPRVASLRKLAIELESVNGAVAECGVNRGHFAGYINEIFPKRKLYLFDTFSGFDARDISHETSALAMKWLDDCSVLFNYGSEKAALARCPHRENVIIHKGYIPETFAGLEHESFAFVNLDMDLYQPTLMALRFFTPRMAKGGVVWVHDYYLADLPGTKQAVDEFAMEYDFIRIPCGDEWTVSLCGFEKR